MCLTVVWSTTYLPTLNHRYTYIDALRLGSARHFSGPGFHGGQRRCQTALSTTTELEIKEKVLSKMIVLQGYCSQNAGWGYLMARTSLPIFVQCSVYLTV